MRQETNRMLSEFFEITDLKLQNYFFGELKYNRVIWKSKAETRVLTSVQKLR